MQRWTRRKATIFRGKLAGGVAERMTDAAGGYSRGVKFQTATKGEKGGGEYINLLQKKRHETELNY